MKNYMQADMKIKAIAPWFGGKRNLAPTIVKLLGKHRVYWEPFCGSCAVLLAKPPCMMETVNDLHGDLTNIARILQDENTAIELYKKLSDTLICEVLHKEAVIRYCAAGYNWHSPSPSVNRAYDYLLCSWLGKNGFSGAETDKKAFNFCLRYTGNGGNPAKRFTSVVDNIPAWHQRLKNVIIITRDAFLIIEKIDDAEDTVIYVDPPYLNIRTKYQHDFETTDHTRLAELLRRFKKTRVVVSYYADPQLDELYPNWQRHEINVSKAMSNAGSRGEKDVRAIEVLLTNFKTEQSLFEAESAQSVKSVAKR